MKHVLLIKVLICAFSFGGVLYAYLEQHNDLTKLRIRIPEVVKELHFVEEENVRLRLEIDRFENPKHLMELAKRPEYRHLKHPIVDDILVIAPGKQLSPREEIEKSHKAPGLWPGLVIGSMPK
jgi:hypothetical protein